MIDEFKIRSQVAEIATAPTPPMQRARLILRLARRIRAAARSLAVLSGRAFREGDTLRGARMREAMHRLLRTGAEVRSHAGSVLAETSLGGTDVPPEIRPPQVPFSPPGAASRSVPTTCPPPSPSSPASPRPSHAASL